MSDMMRKFVEQELDSQIKDRYPHMRYPPCMYAKVTAVTKKADIYTYTLKILDKNKQPAKQFPEVPMVKTKIEVTKGCIVAIVLMYGECEPYIVGRCVFWLMPFGLFMELWECHKQFSDISKPKRILSIDDVIPYGI